MQKLMIFLARSFLSNCFRLYEIHFHIIFFAITKISFYLPRFDFKQTIGTLQITLMFVLIQGSHPVLNRLDAKGQKISKAKYQVLPSSKKPMKFCTFFCPSLKKMVETKNKSTQLFKLVIRGYLIQWRVFIFFIHSLLEARAKNVQNFVGFLEYGRTWCVFCFRVY